MSREGILIRQLQGMLAGGWEIRSFSVNGATGALIAESQNADVSVARTAAGRYTATWTRPWLNANYVVLGSCFWGVSGIGVWSLDPGVAFTKSGFAFATVDNVTFTDLVSMIVALGPT